MNSITVAKFGGTSMADATAMKKSADIVSKNTKIKLIVVSATSGTSNQLIEIYNHFCAGHKIKAQKLLESIELKHTAIAKSLHCTSDEWQELQSLFQEMNEFACVLSEIIDHKNPLEIAKHLDHFLSFGEKISANLFMSTLRAQQVDCAFFDIKKVIITDDNFGKAEPILQEIAERSELFLQPELTTHKVQIVQGFVGATKFGETTTLGRGGSDFTAALLAESLRSDELQIWTDVPGIMTIDPHLVSTAKVIPQISFPVAAELATFGAKVLHPETLWPAVRQNIKTFVGSTFTPEREGTWIHPAYHSLKPIRAIAVRKKQVLITVHSLHMFNAHGFLARVFGILAVNKLSVDLVTTSEVSVALTIDQNNLGSSGEGISKYSKMFEEMKEFCEVTIEEGLTLVAIIGTDLIDMPRFNARVFRSIAQFNVRLMCHGASPHNLCFLVSEDKAIEVARRLHK